MSRDGEGFSPQFNSDKQRVVWGKTHWLRNISINDSFGGFKRSPYEARKTSVKETELRFLTDDLAFACMVALYTNVLQLFKRRNYIQD